MSTTDLASIVAAWDLVLTGAVVGLAPSQLAFSHDRQPNAQLQNTYWLEDGGIVNRRSTTNDMEVRIDRLRLYIAKPMAFAGRSQQVAMLALFDTIYRELAADGRANGWNVELLGHRVTSPAKSEIVVGSLDLSVDYDFSVAAS